MNYKLYKNNYTGSTIIIPESGLEEKIWIGDNNVYYREDEKDIDAQFISSLKAYLAEQDEDLNYCNLNDFAEGISFKALKEEESPRCLSVMYNDGHDIIVTNLDQFDAIPTYSYWDGHNFITMLLDDDQWSVEAIFDDDMPTYNLDKWTGNDYQYDSVGRHASVVVLPDERYIVRKTSQWQGEYDTGALLNSNDELKDYLDSEEDYANIISLQ